MMSAEAIVSDIAINVSGTSSHRPYDTCGCSSWIDHWRRHSSSRRTRCMTIGCGNDAVVGAHVRRYRGRTVYIIGLCRSCNHTSNDEHFHVDERSWWIEPVYQPGCGVLASLRPSHVVVKSPTSAERFTLIEDLGFLDSETARWTALSSSREKVMNVTLSAEKARRVG
jgi:hypothetical protein